MVGYFINPRLRCIPFFDCLGHNFLASGVYITVSIFPHLFLIFTFSLTILRLLENLGSCSGVNFPSKDEALVMQLKTDVFNG